MNAQICAFKASPLGDADRPGTIATRKTRARYNEIQVIQLTANACVYHLSNIVRAL